MINSKSNAEILDQLNGLVWGHDLAKKSLINLINRSKIRHHQKYILMQRDVDLLPPGKCLLIGGSGTGKTYLIQTLQKLLKFPLLILDATQLNPTGASGGIKASDINKLIAGQASAHMKKHPELFHSVEGTVDQMVVFIDEIDKLGKSFESSGNWNSHVQSNFLTTLENNHENFGISYIFAGAFTGIEKEQKSKESTIGFNRSESAITPQGIAAIDNLDEAIVKYGMMPELVGRISSIIALDTLTEENYYDILINKLVPEKLTSGRDYFQFDRDSLKMDDARLMAKKAYTSGQGVRSLKRSLDLHFSELEFNYEERNPSQHAPLTSENYLLNYLDLHNHERDDYYEL